MENLPEPKPRSIVECRSREFLLKWVRVPTGVSILNNKLKFRVSTRYLPEKLEKDNLSDQTGWWALKSPAIIL